MSRTILEIAESIEAEKNTKPELTALNSPSAVSIWKLIRGTMAFAMWVLEATGKAPRNVTIDLLANDIFVGLPLITHLTPM